MEVNEVHRPGFHGGYKALVLRPRPLLLNPLLALRLRQLRLQQQLAGSLYGGLYGGLGGGLSGGLSGGLGGGLSGGIGGGLGGAFGGLGGGHYGGGLFSGGLGGHYGGGGGFGGISGPAHHHDNSFNQGEQLQCLTISILSKLWAGKLNSLPFFGVILIKLYFPSDLWTCCCRPENHQPIACWYQTVQCYEPETV